jgi:hypothetical protein
MSSSNERMTFRSALAFVVAAGSGGCTTTDMALAFTLPDTHQKRSNRASQIMRELAGRGLTEKTGTERSPLYRHGPVSRWRATQEGIAQSARTEAAGEASRREVLLDELEAAGLERRQAALADAREAIAKRYQSGLNITRCFRRRMILDLRQVPCTLAEIGELFGIQRERTRQIEMGLERRCACRECITG